MRESGSKASNWCAVSVILGRAAEKVSVPSAA